jgi:hypothetical protein
MVTPMNEDYFIQRPHMNFFNKIYFSEFMKRYNPFHEWRSYHPYYHTRLANWYGTPPHSTWVDGSIDYTYSKYNKETIGHFDMHENRKNKPFRNKDGALRVPNFAKAPIYPVYAIEHFPKGCNRQITNYKKCVKNKKDPSKCLDDKISIMEICPKWVLEILREKKRVLLRATLIDNETYRRAMKVESYNQGRTLRDLKDDNKNLNVRGDGYWYDDRYNPTVYPSADQNTNVNLGYDPLYNDVLGGNNVDRIQDNRKKFSTNSYENLKSMSDSE